MNKRVTFILSNIRCDNVPLQAALALVRNDTNTDTGKMCDFELTASFISPPDSVIKKKTFKDGYIISDLTRELEDNNNIPPTERVRSGRV